MRPPVTIPGYEVDRVVGRGGQGLVLGGRNRAGAPVAIKVIEKRGGGESVERFRREQRLLALLGEREGFVPLLDAGETAAGPFFVMPFLSGGTLRDRLTQGALAVNETVSLGIDLGRALGRAHERGIVHRDFKPENVLFTGAGRPLVADLGLAKHWSHDFAGGERSIALSRTGDARGTLGYMASEQLADSSRALPPSDVFSLGCVLYECLTGRGAFEGASAVEVVAKIECHELVPLREACPHAPRWLVEVVDRALAHEPEDRFEDGEALALALEARGAESRESSPWRRPLQVLGGLALVALVTVGGIWGRARLRRSEAQRIATSALERLGRRESVPLGEVERALELAPDLAVAWLARAQHRANEWQNPEAIADATHAIGLDAGLARAYLLRARIHEREPPQWREAEADLDRVIALEPGNADAYEMRSSARGAQHKYALAYADLSRAVALAPDHASAWAARAAYAGALGKQEERLADAEKAIQLDPKLAGAWFNHAMGLVQKKDWKGAEADLTHGLDLDPESVTALANRSYVRSEAGDLAGAIVDMTTAIRLDPKRAASFLERGVLRAQQGEWTLALEDAQKAVSLNADVPKGWALLGWVQFELGDLDGGHAACTRALEIDSKNVSARSRRAVIRFRQGNWDGALDDASRTLELDAGDRQARVVRAVLRDRAQDWKAAAEDYEILTQFPSAQADVWSNLGAARAKLGDAKGAVEAQNKALELDPGYAVALARRGYAREDLGDLAGARADYARYLDAAPGEPMAADVRRRLARLAAEGR